MLTPPLRCRIADSAEGRRAVGPVRSYELFAAIAVCFHAHTQSCERKSSKKIKDITIRQSFPCNTCLRGAPPQLNKAGFMLPKSFELKLGNIVIYAPRQTVALLFVCGQCCKSVSSNIFFLPSNCIFMSCIFIFLHRCDVAPL